MVASFDELLAQATARAFAAAPHPVTTDLVIADVPIRIEATDAELSAAFRAALAHHVAGARVLGHDANPRPATIRVWSAAATGVARPEMPAEIRERVINRRADLAPGAHFQLDFDPTARMLTVMHPGSGDVDVCLNHVDELPQWERAAPLRSALGWILRRHDRHLMHAAAVCDGQGRAALLLGAGGAGKSTTSLRCREAGMGFLGDDICAVSPGLDPRVHNVYGTAKAVWPDHGRFPELVPLLVTGSADHDYKAVYAVNRADDSRIVPAADLRVLIMIDRHAPVGTTAQVPAAQAVALVATTTAAFLPGSGRSMLEALGDLARRLPILRMSVGEEPGRVAELISAAIADPRAALGGAHVG